MKQYSSSLLLCNLIKLPIACSMVLVLLTGCSENDFSGMTQYIAEVKLKPKGTIKQLPAIKVIQPFIFKPEDLRDPFKPIKPTEEPLGGQEQRGNGIKPDTSRRKEELEAFPVETLKMIGTVKDAKSNLWALVKSADKTVYRVKEGNYMGQNYGKIIRVTADKIELMEIVPDQPGMWREQQMSIMLAEEKN